MAFKNGDSVEIEDRLSGSLYKRLYGRVNREISNNMYWIDTFYPDITSLFHEKQMKKTNKHKNVILGTTELFHKYVRNET